MDEVADRLVRCFSSVFPDLNTEQIYEANVDSLSAWDSLAAVTLVAVIQEEFGLQIDLADLPALTSFAAVRNYVRERMVTSS